MGLETRDCPRFACLAHNVNGLAHPNGNGQVFQLVIECDKEAGIHGCYKEVKHPVRLVEDN